MGETISAAGQAVVLTVADPRIAVPDLSNKHVRTAREMIKEAGLKVGTVRERYFNRGSAYHVLEQTPAAGELVEPGTKVNLVINEGDY